MEMGEGVPQDAPQDAPQGASGNSISDNSGLEGMALLIPKLTVEIN